MNRFNKSSKDGIMTYVCYEPMAQEIKTSRSTLKAIPWVNRCHFESIFSTQIKILWSTHIVRTTIDQMKERTFFNFWKYISLTNVVNCKISCHFNLWREWNITIINQNFVSLSHVYTLWQISFIIDFLLCIFRNFHLPKRS